MESLLLNDIWKCFKLENGKTLPVLQGLQLQMESGEMAAVMGPSGSGKTTLLNLISGIDRPDRGNVIIDGQNLAGLNATEKALFRRRKLGVIFQDFCLLESLTVRENILLPMILDGKSPEEQEKRLGQIANTLGIGDILAKNVTDISGGQKQRAAVARALMNRPSLLLADEPTGNLDMQATGEVLRQFTEINRQTGTGILMVTHDAFAASCCQRVVFLREGKFADDIRQTGNRKEFFDAVTETLVKLGGGPNDFF